MGILYSKFGYDVKLLEREHGVQIFKLLSAPKLPSSEGLEPEQYQSKRNGLKSEIVYALETDKYNSIGVFKGNKLLGISFNSFNKEIEQPWMGYFYMEPESRKTKANVVLMNYLLNHLYNGYIMRMSTSMKSEYAKNIKPLSVWVGYSVFKDGFKERLARICDSGSRKVE